MGQRGVAHFVRLSSQLNSSFILNQIYNHSGFHPVVIVFKREQIKQNVGIDLLLKKNVQVLFLSDDKDLLSRICYLLFRKITIFQKKRILRFLGKNNIKLMHFHFGNDAGIFLPSLHKSGYPSVVSFYGDDCSGFPHIHFGLGLYWLKYRVFAKASWVFAMSPDMKMRLLFLGCPADKIKIHYFGADINRFYCPDRIYPDSRESIQLLMISNLVPKKGHFFLFQALMLLNHKGVTKYHLVIVGSGPMENQIRTFVQENNLTEFIRFIPHIEYLSSDFINIYRESDIFIHPSITGKNNESEGIPGVIIEAMASGLPVISTNHAGIPSIIEHDKTGWLVDEWDVDSLCEAMESLILNPSKRKSLGQEGQKFAVSELNLFTKEIELENLYSGLIGKEQK
jgi:colanic acid/amylovoran biosynthesis glycosyltransferase